MGRNAATATAEGLTRPARPTRKEREEGGRKEREKRRAHAFKGHLPPFFLEPARGLTVERIVGEEGREDSVIFAFCFLKLLVYQVVLLSLSLSLSLFCK